MRQLARGRLSCRGVQSCMGWLSVVSAEETPRAQRLLQIQVFIGHGFDRRLLPNVTDLRGAREEKNLNLSLSLKS